LIPRKLLALALLVATTAPVLADGCLCPCRSEPSPASCCRVEAQRLSMSAPRGCCPAPTPGIARAPLADLALWKLPATGAPPSSTLAVAGLWVPVPSSSSSDAPPSPDASPPRDGPLGLHLLHRALLI
jgi:hypothetical protein